MTMQVPARRSLCQDRALDGLPLFRTPFYRTLLPVTAFDTNPI
ncbi:hypothetical protein MY4038_009829 [Beauveria bassiana]